VAECIECVLAEVRKLRAAMGRIERQEPEAGDWPLMKAALAREIEEAEEAERAADQCDADDAADNPRQ
jgi:hypothetical protein